MRWRAAVWCAVPTLLILAPASLRAQGRPWIAGPLALDSARLVTLRSSAPWIAHVGQRVTIYAQPGSYAEAHAPELLRRADRAAVDNLRLLGLPEYTHRLHLFFFDSEAAMEAATRRGGTGGGFPEAQTAFVVVNAKRPRPDDGHELAHLQSLTAWGLNRAEDVWLREGLGVLAQPTCWGAPIQELAAAARRAGDRRTMADLSGAGFFSGDVDARFRAYMLAASFVEYLMRTDRTKFLELWHRGATEAQAIYGVPLGDVEARWEAGVPVNAPSVSRIDLIAAQRAGCRT